MVLRSLLNSIISIIWVCILFEFFFNDMELIICVL